MATFTASVDLDLRYFGNAVVGTAGTTHRIPDALAEEFEEDVAPGIPGFAWVVQDEGSTILAGTITVGSGDTAAMYGPATPQLGRFVRGTSASPDTTLGPLLKVERTLNVAHDSLSGDGVDSLAAIYGISIGTSAFSAQPVGVAAFAKNSGTTNGADRNADACGLYAVGQVTGSGVGSGIGAFVSGRRDNDTGRATALEVALQNYGTVDGTYLSTGASALKGIWINALGNADAGVGISFGNAFGRQFKVGIAFSAQTTGGKVGAVADASIRDDGNATLVFDINGSHTDILNTQGATISGKLFKINTPGTYTVSNVTTDRSYDADSTTTAELADVLGTLIADLRTLGLVS